MPTIKLQVRRDTAAQWTSNNPILLPGEIGFELDTGKVKIGKSTSQTWQNIPYITTDTNAHSHPVSDIQASGTRNSDTYLRGDGKWVPISGSAGITYRQIDLGFVTGDVTIDAYAGEVFTFTMTGNINLSINNLPAVPPYVCLIRAEQGGSGNNTITWHSTYKHPNNTPPSIGMAVGNAEWFYCQFVFADPNRVEIFKAEGPYLA